jgi:hypothetical protein
MNSVEEESSEWYEINSSSEEQSNQVKNEIKSIGNFIRSVRTTIDDLFDEIQKSNDVELNICSCFNNFFTSQRITFIDEIFNLFFEDSSQDNHDRLLQLFDLMIRNEIVKNENISLYNVLGKHENNIEKFIKGVKDNYFLFYILIKKTLETEFDINLNENQSLQIIFISFPLLISSFE